MPQRYAHVYVENASAVYLLEGCVAGQGHAFWMGHYHSGDQHRPEAEKIAEARSVAQHRGLRVVRPGEMAQVHALVSAAQQAGTLPDDLPLEVIAQALEEWDVHSLLVCNEALPNPVVLT